MLSEPATRVPPPRVEALIPILQQVGGAVWGGHLRGHHVPADLVGGPHRHRRRPLPPALRHLQEARYAVSGHLGVASGLSSPPAPTPTAHRQGLHRALGAPRWEAPMGMGPLRAHTSTTGPSPGTQAPGTAHPGPAPERVAGPWRTYLGLRVAKGWLMVEQGTKHDAWAGVSACTQTRVPGDSDLGAPCRGWEAWGSGSGPALQVAVQVCSSRGRLFCGVEHLDV